VTGSADLQGGTVEVVRASGDYLLGQSYEILSAGGGINGTFDAIDSTAISPFLAFGLDYGSNAVWLNVFRGMALAEAAQTRNQRAVATAADALADSDALLLRLTQLFPADAVEAFDALSGEYHASMHSMLVDGSRHVRDAALDRAVALASPAGGDDAGATAWVQAFGTGGGLDGDGNAAALDWDGSGTLVGIDYAFADGWRVGALGGVERNDARLPARGSEGDVRSRHLGVYAGKQWGAVELRAGAAHARHDVDSERTVVFPGVDQYLMDEYGASTTQLFVEGGYRFGGAQWSVQPYLQYAHVQVESDAIAETGGSVALSGGNADSGVNLATAGVRFDLGLRSSGQSASWLRWRSMLGWRHASGDVIPQAQLAWAGGQTFTVAGAPVADGAALVETGLAAWLGEDTLLELNYSGQFADESRDHGLSARLSYQF
jgi:subtilase-type serine protease